MQVAVLGTGIMGAGMARSLLREGLSVRVWNRSTDKAKPLADEGAVVAATPVEAVSGADVVITMLYDEESVLSVIEGSLAGFGSGTVWLQSSTIGVSGMARVSGLARQESLSVLDAPVLGTKKPADEGTLVILASGDTSLLDRAQPAVSAIGSRTVWAGDRLGQASALKLACNAWVASINAAVGQSIALARALELRPELFLEAIKGGPLDTAYAHLKGASISAGDYTPSFALDGVLKDLGLISAAAVAAGVDTTLLSALAQVYQKASDGGHGDDDMAAVYTAFPAPPQISHIPGISPPASTT